MKNTINFIKEYIKHNKIYAICITLWLFTVILDIIRLYNGDEIKTIILVLDFIVIATAALDVACYYYKYKNKGNENEYY